MRVAQVLTLSLLVSICHGMPSMGPQIQPSAAPSEDMSAFMARLLAFITGPAHQQIAPELPKPPPLPKPSAQPPSAAQWLGPGSDPCPVGFAAATSAVSGGHPYIVPSSQPLPHPAADVQGLHGGHCPVPVQPPHGAADADGGQPLAWWATLCRASSSANVPAAWNSICEPDEHASRSATECGWWWEPNCPHYDPPWQRSKRRANREPPRCAVPSSARKVRLQEEQALGGVVMLALLLHLLGAKPSLPILQHLASTSSATAAWQRSSLARLDGMGRLYLYHLSTQPRETRPVTPSTCGQPHRRGRCMVDSQPQWSRSNSSGYRVRIPLAGSSTSTPPHLVVPAGHALVPCGQGLQYVPRPVVPTAAPVATAPAEMPAPSRAPFTQSLRACHTPSPRAQSQSCDGVQGHRRHSNAVAVLPQEATMCTSICSSNEGTSTAE